MAAGVETQAESASLNFIALVTLTPRVGLNAALSIHIR